MKAEITSKELSEIPDIITALIPGIVLDKALLQNALGNGASFNGTILKYTKPLAVKEELDVIITVVG